MNFNPPQNSKIKVSDHDGMEMITIHHAGGNIMRYLIAAFLIFWMGGWFMGFTSAFEQVMDGKGGAFLIFWLGGWSVGGIFAIFFLYRLFRKSVPERLLLNSPNLSYDSGIPPFQMSFHPSSQKEYWKSLFVKRNKTEFGANELESLVLREVDSGNRLTIDVGAKRLEIAKGASEVEREQLYEHLRSKYS